MRRWAAVWLTLAWAAAVQAGPAPPIRAAYFYHYMGAAHLDSLHVHGFDRAVIHWIPDTLGVAGQAELHAYAARALALGIEVTPQWSLQSPVRLQSRPRDRRYTWGRGRREAEVPCPNDSLYWRSALLDRAAEFLSAAPSVTCLAIDPELYRGGRHHYDAGPCRCRSCLAAYAAGRPLSSRGENPSLAGLLGWQEARLERTLAGILAEFATRYPGVELGVFDLDLDSFVHRALARALARAAVPTVDYSERSYASGGAALVAARGRLDALGQKGTPLIGGLWLKRHSPEEVPAALRAIATTGDGYFVFTTFSLWLDPARLEGPYTLSGSPQDYWAALAEANRQP